MEQTKMDTNDTNGRDEAETTVKKEEATEETGVVKAETKPVSYTHLRAHET